MIITKETAPHLRRKESVTRMMLDVLIALAPTLIFSFVAYPLNTLYVLLISIGVMVAAEFVFVGLKNMMPKDGLKHSFKERFLYSYKGKFTQNNIITPIISAVIFTLIMPAGAPLYAVVVGAFVGIVFGKLVFGGLGSNIFNPAAVGMVFAKICFGSKYQPVSSWYYSQPLDVTASATPLNVLSEKVSDIGHYDLLNMFLGRIPGTLGEVYKVTILLGLLYLLIRRSIDWRIVVSYLGTFSVLILLSGLAIYSRNSAINPFTYLLYHLLSGGVLFGGYCLCTIALGAGLRE